ncbi:hypothetical protein Tco_1516313 [Tanacetum coccineum]
MTLTCHLTIFHLWSTNFRTRLILFYYSFDFEKNASKRTPITDAAIKELIAQGVANALADYEANRSSRNGLDSHNTGSGGGRTSNTARVCTYKDFLNCQPLNFKGTKGVVGLTQWFEKMESVFHISNYTVECQIKYATCTFLGSALMWWNSHVKSVEHDAAYAMPWRTLMKMMTDKYCLSSEIKKLEIERMLPEESDQVEKYVGGLPDMIQGNVMSARPKTMQEAIELANDLMDQKVHTFAERHAKNKRRLDNNPKDNHIEQPPYKRQNVARAYSAGSSEKKEYAGTLPLCNKCKFHHARALSVCPKLKNRNHRNQSGNGEACGRVYDLGGGETDQHPNNIKGEIEA